MSDERPQSEDQAILLALAMQPHGVRAPDGLDGPDADAALETLARLYVETLGMLPLALDPVTPSAGLKGRVLMAATGDETQEVRNPFAPRATGLPTVKPATVVPLSAKAFPPARSRLTPAAIPPSGAVSVPVSRGASARLSRWPFRLAATLAVAAVGLSGWLGWQVEEQKGELARLRTEAKQAKERDLELARLREAVKSFESNVALVSSAAVLVCPLRPAVGGAAAPLGSRAVLYVAADHQHWYFVARGLAPSPPDREYQLWFAADGRQVSGGTFSMKPGDTAHLGSATMPAGTSAVSITLERKGGAVIPTGPQVLLGDQMQQIS